MTEEEALKNAAKNDKDSFEWLIIKYKALVSRIARSYFLLSGGSVEDLVQEGTIGFLKAVCEYKPEAGKAFRSFAAACVENKIKDALRLSLGRSNSVLNDALSLEDGGSPLLDLADPASVYEIGERKELFYSELKKLLSNREFSVIKLYLEGFSYREIAEKLSLKQKTVDNSLSSAKTKIKKSEIL
jgi:RNA polymerase sigma factor, sigma-70 family